MKNLSYDELIYKLNMKEIDSDIKRIKSDINEKMDVYFIDEDKIVFDTMMKDYTGGKHKTYENMDKTDIKKFNDYKNDICNMFKKER